MTDTNKTQLQRAQERLDMDYPVTLDSLPDGGETVKGRPAKQRSARVAGAASGLVGYDPGPLSLLYLERHLPGKHNQKTHGGGKGSDGYIAGSDLLAGDSSAYCTSRIKVADRRANPGFVSYGPNGNEHLYAIAESQGFARKPKVVSQSELDDAISHGAVEMHRGITDGIDNHGKLHPASELMEQFRTGSMYAGEGVFGNGTYTAIDRSYITGHYRVPEDQMLRMALRPGARVIDHADLKQEHESWLSSHGDGGSPEHHLLYDRGHYAAARGYDAIRVPLPLQSGADFYVILNRTAVIVQEG